MVKMLDKTQTEKLNEKISKVLCKVCLLKIDKLNKETGFTDLFKRRKLENASNMICTKCRIKIIQEVYKK